MNSRILAGDPEDKRWGGYEKVEDEEKKERIPDVESAKPELSAGDIEGSIVQIRQEVKVIKESDNSDVTVVKNAVPQEPETVSDQENTVS